MDEAPTVHATPGVGGRCGEVFSFLAYVVRGQWFTLLASFLVMAGAGGTYLFGIYSNEVKVSLGYDQTTLNLLSFFKDLGTHVGVSAGLIAEVTPTWFVLLLGSAMNFAGYFMVWLAITGKIGKPKVWQMCIYFCLGAHSQNFSSTAAHVTGIKSFTESRGILIGLLQGFFGLSGAIMTQLYLAIYGYDFKSLILLVGWLPAAIPVIFAYTIRPMKVVKQPNELRVFYSFFYVSIALALFLMVMTIVQKEIAFSQVAYIGSATVVCILLFSPLVFVLREEFILWKLTKNPINPTNTTLSVVESKAAPLQADSSAQAAQLEENPQTSYFADIFKKPNRGEDHSILQALLSIDMLLLFIVTLCGIGSSLAAINNLGQIGESLGYPTRTVSTFVSLLSIWNYFGRVFAGFVSERLLTKWKIPCPLVMALFLLLLCIGHFLIAFPAPGSVYAASVIIGFSFGTQLPLIIAIISELFGLKHFATLFSCGLLASPIGSYVMSVRVTGFLYDKEALKELAMKGLDKSSMKELTCTGTHCYRLSFIIVGLVTLFGVLASLVLVMRTREFYKDIKMILEEYILKRWTRDARKGNVQEMNNDQDIQGDPKMKVTEQYRMLCYLVRITARAAEFDEAFNYVAEVPIDLMKKVEEVCGKQLKECPSLF
ncbi:hypothetical protein F0562_002005 [Nyssa sinensis]|uniref:Uncharacterized protein n=1 Tax=Nyssa sinensis TaxID=561372 RepID=A0A5J5C9R0_9ASTE|nr:hypothetical protein F0562_002005 [Nyssa sinensis]